MKPRFFTPHWSAFFRAAVFLTLSACAPLAGTAEAPTATTTPSATAERPSAPWLAFDQDRAFEYLKKQVAFGPRVPGTPGHRRCLAWMDRHFRSLGFETQRQSFTHIPPLMGSRAVPCHNLIVWIPAEKSSKRLALSAHWDTRAFADLDPDPASRRLPIPGANDGGSGVAVLMEMAQVFRDSPPPVNIVIILFDMEDGGRYTRTQEWCVGSTYAANNWPKARPIDWGVNIDMIGDRDLLVRPDILSLRKARPWLVHVWQIATRQAPKNFSRTPWPNEITDDHVPFLEKKIPYINLIDFDYEPWHTLADDVSACSAESLGVIGGILGEVVYSLPQTWLNK